MQMENRGRDSAAEAKIMTAQPQASATTPIRATSVSSLNELVTSSGDRAKVEGLFSPERIRKDSTETILIGYGLGATSIVSAKFAVILAESSQYTATVALGLLALASAWGAYKFCKAGFDYGKLTLTELNSAITTTRDATK